MKKRINSGLCLLLSVLLLFTFVGCGNGAEPADAGIKAEETVEAKTETAAETKTEETAEAKVEEKLDTKVTVPSRITGEELAAELGMTAGVYAVEYYDWNQAECLLPDPVAWSGGQLQLNDISEGHIVLPDASFGAESIYYIFKADSAETMQACMDGYLQELAARGFSCESDRVLLETWYYLTKGGYPQLLIAPNSILEMEIVLPLCYGFEIPEEKTETPLLMASSFLASDYDCEKDRFTVSGFDGTENGGYFTVYLAPDLYREGSVFDTEMFRSQANGNKQNAICYCSFLSKVASETGYSTLKAAIPFRSDAESYNYFSEVEVEVLRLNDAQAAFYFYAEIDAGKGTMHRIEGVVNAFPIDTAAGDVASAADGDCPECDGKGYTTCTYCGGSGREKCRRCSGRGKTKSPLTHKYETCQGCHGTGERSCTSCDNGKKECRICHGTGKAS